MKSDIWLLSSLAFLLFILQMAYASGAVPDDSRKEWNAWVAACLADFERIVPGMTRAEIEATLPQEVGGLQSPSLLRLTHPDCPYFKIDVRFEPRRDTDGKLVPTAGDKAVEVSKPYIQPPIRD